MNRLSLALRRFLLIPVVVVFLGMSPAEATWSVVIADTETGELAAGSVTCGAGDLLASTPMVLVGIGIGIVQGGGDNTGTRRQAMLEAFLNGASAQEVLDSVTGFGGNNRRQFGICSTESCATFTGGGTGSWSGGVAGQTGNIVYAVQGNILAGSCVVVGMVDAILGNADQDVPDILMAAMNAARAMGGDGRCSCRHIDNCGCPPVPTLDRTGVIGYMLTTRAGDSDDLVCDRDGCADGNYFMKFNVISSGGGPDPVGLMQQMFTDWRAGLAGHPDAVHSVATIAPDGTDFVMTVQVRDWEDNLVSDAGLGVDVAHNATSAGVSIIGTVVETSTAGVFEVPLTIPGGASGNDVFRITANGLSSVILMPNAQLSIGGVDADGDGFVAEPVGTDCDDTDPLVNPAATEVCDDGIDNDCDGFIDAADPDCGIPPDCAGKNEPCSANSDCCSGNCNTKKGKCSGGSKVAGIMPDWAAMGIDASVACPLLPQVVPLGSEAAINY